MIFRYHTKWKMFYVVDLIIIAILALCIFMGYKKGLAQCAIKVLSFFIALIIAVMLFKPISLIVINNTQIDENIQTSIIQMFEKEEKNDENSNKEKSSPIIEYMSNEVEKATQEKKNEIVNSVAKEISLKIINIFTFIILFIIARIALIFVKALTDLITKLPLIKQCDKIGGILYGILQGFIIIFVGFALITFVSTMINKYSLLELINQSYIGNILCNNNILLKLFF